MEELEIPELDAQVRDEQLLRLADQSLTGSVGAAAAAIGASAALYAQVDQRRLIAWLVVILAVNAARGAASLAFRHKHGLEHLRRWKGAQIALVATSGIAWGVSPILLWPVDPLYQIVLPIFLVGLSASSATAYSAVRSAATPYPILALGPLAFRFLSEGTVPHAIVGTLALVYVALLLRISQTMYEASAKTLRAGLENQALVALLSDKTLQLEEMVRVDGLTGIANRVRFDEALQREWRRAHRVRGPVAVLMIDVDHFKRFNDHYGHAEGDECLKAVARALEDNVRGEATDVLARYGGEEFAAVLGDTDLEAAREIAERLRAEVEALGIPHADSPVTAHVTISIGVASRQPSDPDSAVALVQSADHKLYRAKEAGRNQVVA
jgi:diguanylate cyclase (GGDEF)-like protein